MSVPEIILQRALINGIQGIRKNPKTLNLLFKHLSQQHQQSIKDFFLKTPIDICLNYPRDSALKAPAILILLKNESEKNTFLGDVMGYTGSYDTPDWEMSYETDEHGHVFSSGTVSTLRGLPPALTGAMRVLEAGDNYVVLHPEDRDQLRPLFENKTLECCELHVVRGTGAGQRYYVSKITPTTIDIGEPFEIPLDSTSIVVLRDVDPIPGVDGEPSRIYDAQDPLWRQGAEFETQYQLSILGSSQEECIYLYTIVKAILFLSKAYLEGQGIQALSVSGTDFAPRTEYLPDIVYQRSMILQFTYPFSVLTEMETIKELQIALTPAVVTEEHLEFGSVTLTATIDLESGNND